MAALWKLPLVFAVCTNQFCEMSYMCEHYPTQDVAPRAAGYGIPYEIADGQDVETVAEITQRAVDHARSGKGPYLVEFKTFRMALHFSGDPGGYVKQEDLEAWAKRDPIDLCQKKLMERGVLTPDKDAAIRAEILDEVTRTAEEAAQSPDPTVEDLFEDVYAEGGML